ncbi:TolB family protein [Pendulispora albinea]|uniref:WD40 repeat protein n=1 Tax=Pendulispora albinea TaxID=2741071 RepID=A0ABZ2LX65_9BACT
MRKVSTVLVACLLGACAGEHAGTRTSHDARADHEARSTIAPGHTNESSARRGAIDGSSAWRVVIDGEPELAFPKVVTTEHSEVKLTFSPDGRRMLWGSTDRTGGAGAWDIWEVVREGQGWSPPHPVPFNSAGNDFDPSFAPDGSGVYFFSNRPQGLGGDDVYFVSFRDGTYGEPANLGPHVNSAGDEWGPVVAPDGQHLLFASDGRGGSGKHDLFWSARRDRGWAPAENLGPDINSERDDFDAAFLHDGRTLVFASERRGDDRVDLYTSVPSGGRYQAPTWLGATVNSDTTWDFGAAIDPREPGVFYYNSQRPPNTLGRSDIYRVRYHLAPP